MQPDPRARTKRVLRRLFGPAFFPLAAGARAFADAVRAFSAPGYAHSVRVLETFRDRHGGQRCVIIGNGPSLKRMDLSFLGRETCFGLNRIYLLSRRLGFSIDYFVSINTLVLEQFAADIAALPCPKFIALPPPPSLRHARDVVLLRTLAGYGFATEPAYGVWTGHTVTYVALQLAYFMGFRTVVLIGVDHSFTTPGPPNKEITMDRADANHFDPSYFSPGVRWQLPDLENSEIAYRIAKVAFERDGRRVIDATLDGRLTVFEKADYRELFI